LSSVEEKLIEDDVIERYLLGELPDDDRAGLESRLFTDPAFPRQIEIVEDDLIDRYVRGELAPADRRSFDSHFLLPPARQERLRMAAALLDRLDARRPLARPRRSYAREMALLAASLLIAALLAIIWLWLDNHTMREQMQIQQTARTRAEASERTLRAELARRTAPASKVTPPLPRTALETVAAVLLPGLVRDGDREVATVELTSKTGNMRLEAVLENATKTSRFDATVQRAGEAPVWSQRALAPRRVGKDLRLVLTIPRDRLGPGEYLLTLTSPDTVADYPFVVRSRE
jgi:anti-sigma factor RsiW